MEDKWHTLSSDEAITKLKSSYEGLYEKEAEARLKQYGENRIEETLKINPYKILFSQFNSFFIYILLIAALISAFLVHWLDFSVIIVIVVLNGFLGFTQQYRAEKAIQNLKHILIPSVKVIRDGKIKEISSFLLVPGDIIVFNEGDKIMADARIM